MVLTPEEQVFTQSRVNAVTLQALVLHMCNAAVARAAADAADSKQQTTKGTAPTAGLAALALSSAPVEILRALIVELEPEVCAFSSALLSPSQLLPLLYFFAAALCSP